MADQATALPIRTEDDIQERVQVKLVDYLNPGTGLAADQQMSVDTDHNAHVEIHGNDEAGDGCFDGLDLVIVDVDENGVATQIADADSPSVTVTDANSNGIPDDAHATLGPVPAGHTILMYVKFGPGLKGLPLPAPPNNTCENENEAMVENVTQSATANLIVVLK